VGGAISLAFDTLGQRLLPRDEAAVSREKAGGSKPLV
jgi:hypothetical protein